MRMTDEQSRFHEAQEAWQQPDISGRDSMLDMLGSRQRQRQGKMRNPLEGYSEKGANKPAGARHGGRRRGASDSSDASAASSFLYEEDLAELDQELEKESSSDEEWGKPKTKKKKMTFRAPRGRRGFGRTPFSYQPVSPYSQFGHPSPYPQHQQTAYYAYGAPGMQMAMSPQPGVYPGALQAASPYTQMGPPRGRFPGRPPAFGASAYDYNRPAPVYQTPAAVYQQQAPAFAYQQQMTYDPAMGAPFAAASPTEFNAMSTGEPFQSPYSDAIWDTMLQQTSPGMAILFQISSSILGL